MCMNSKMSPLFLLKLILGGEAFIHEELDIIITNPKITQMYPLSHRQLWIVIYALLYYLSLGMGPPSAKLKAWKSRG